jgi:hypothetical protein
MLIRWHIGDPLYPNLLLLNLSVLSFQTYYPELKCCILYNGFDFNKFSDELKRIATFNISLIEIINQRNEYKSPFKFEPLPGVWWKWIPLSLEEIELHVDIDLFILDRIPAFDNWLSKESDLIITEEVCHMNPEVSLGDFHNKLKTKTKLCNVGFVGTKNNKWKSCFVQCANTIDYPKTTWSNFLDEQGAANFAIQILESRKSLKIDRIPFNDISFWNAANENTKGIHFVGKSKQAIPMFYSLFLQSIQNKCNFLHYTRELQTINYYEHIPLESKKKIKEIYIKILNTLKYDELPMECWG